MAKNNSKSVQALVKLKEYCGETTAHALPFFVKQTTLRGRVFWMSVFVAAMVGNCYHLATLVKTYLTFPSQDVVSLDYSEFEFPFVTFCNNIPVSSSSRDELLAQKDSKLSIYADFINNQFRSLRDKYNITPPYARVATFKGYYENIGYEAVQAGHNISDFLISCKFSGLDCSPDDFTLFRHPEYFNCYTFTGMKTFTDRRARISAGPQDGLTIILYLESTAPNDVHNTYDQHFVLANSAGVRVTIHQPQTSPRPVDDGMDILPGQSTSIALTPSFISKLGWPHGECTSDGTMTDSGTKYTIGTCTDSCLQNVTIANCSCLNSDLPVPRWAKHAGLTYCGYYNSSYQRQFLEALTCENRISRILGTDVALRKACGCTSPCEEMYFAPMVSSSYWPLEQYQRDFYQQYVVPGPSKTSTNKAYTFLKDDILGPNVTRRDVSEKIRKNFLRVNIYLKELAVYRHSQEASYGVDTLLSDLGGTVGLWLGISLISVIEIMSVCIEIGIILMSRDEK